MVADDSRASDTYGDILFHDTTDITASVHAVSHVAGNGQLGIACNLCSISVVTFATTVKRAMDGSCLEVNFGGSTCGANLTEG